MIEENKGAKKTDTTKKKNKKKSIIKELIIIIIFFILVVALVVVSIAYQKEKNKKITAEDVQALQQQEVGKILEEIGEHIVLPEGVMPTVATITDVESLRKEMPFFNKAQNGFKVVVYEDKAILFDPIKQIIVDVAPVYQQDSKINMSESQDTNQKMESANENVNVEEEEVLEDEDLDGEDEVEDDVENDAENDAKNDVEEDK